MTCLEVPTLIQVITVTSSKPLIFGVDHEGPCAAPKAQAAVAKLACPDGKPRRLFRLDAGRYPSYLKAIVPAWRLDAGFQHPTARSGTIPHNGTWGTNRTVLEAASCPSIKRRLCPESGASDGFVGECF